MSEPWLTANAIIFIIMRQSFTDIKTVIGTEPRIAFIKNQLESLFSVIDLESNGKIVDVDGFRLKDFRNWLIPKTESPTEILRYLSAMRNCDVSCQFCYNKGNPEDSVFNTRHKISADEVWFRLGVWSSSKNKMLYIACLPDYELLNNTIWFDVLTELRKTTNQAFCIFTNGRRLTQEVIDKLEGLKPLVLNISLNSIDPDQRQKLMKDKNAETAIKALPLLHAREIPYSTTIVTWPTLSLNTIRETIEYANNNSSTVIDVTLHGYSDNNIPTTDTADNWHSRWLEIVDLVQNIRPKLTTPVTITPALFEEQLTSSYWNECKVRGVIKNSPAYHAGISSGDIITHVGGFQIRDRSELFKILKFGSLEKYNTELIILRSGTRKREKITIDYKYQYPYFPLTEHNPYGLIINQSISHSALEEVKKSILAHNANNVLICTTLLIKKHIEQAIHSSKLFSDIDANIHLQIVKSNWLGGNIIIGDLMVTDDFIDAIMDFTANHNISIDLIIIPGSGFGAWKRDLRGIPVKHIERKCEIPVVAIQNELIQF